MLKTLKTIWSVLRIILAIIGFIATLIFVIWVATHVYEIVVGTTNGIIKGLMTALINLTSRIRS